MPSSEGCGPTVNVDRRPTPWRVFADDNDNDDDDVVDIVDIDGRAPVKSVGRIINSSPRAEVAHTALEYIHIHLGVYNNHRVGGRERGAWPGTFSHGRKQS
jgi:hypothetical protein